MKDKTKRDYFQMALNLQGFGIDELTTAILIATYEALDEKGGDMNLEDILRIKHTTIADFQEDKMQVEIKAKKKRK